MQAEAATAALSAPISAPITTPTASPIPSYTILRIKRKRNEEPLEALVVEARVRRKKSRGAVGLFQYAQTVEDSAWDDATRQKAIQDEVSRIARETATKAAAAATTEGTAPPTAAEAPASPVTRISKEEAASRRYTVVDSEPKSPARRYPAVPPTVYSAKELEARKNARDFRMYDAVRQSETPMSVDESSEMDKFLPMLNDYLSLHDVKPTIPDVPAKSETKAPKTNIDDDDYVWDVFYHRPATLSEWNAAANVGTVTGLPPSLDGYDSASDSEEEFDEADEDSNAEEYYKNDYPEDEDSNDSDEFHEHSDYDETMGYTDEEEQFNGRQFVGMASAD